MHEQLIEDLIKFIGHDDPIVRHIVCSKVRGMVGAYGGLNGLFNALLREAHISATSVLWSFVVDIYSLDLDKDLEIFDAELSALRNDLVKKISSYLCESR